MNEFNNYNSQDNSETKNGQNNHNDFGYGNMDKDSGYYHYSNNMGYNEVSYTPKDKRKKGNKVLTALIAVLSVIAVGTVSIAGYTLLTGNKIDTSGRDSSSYISKSDENKNTKIDRTNLPTVEQLSTPSDALTIPDIVKKVSPSVVGISAGNATGTGIIMSEDGYIITNAHVVDGANKFSVLLPSNYDGSETQTTSSSKSEKDSKSEDNLTCNATLVGKDSQSDIAVLKIEKKGLKAVTFGKSSELVVGEASVVIGNPLGFTLANSVTAGIISALDRSITIEDRTMNLIQTDASINSGNSGGPLINAYGQVIGITSAKVASGYGEGLGFAIPIDEALPIIQDLMKNGYVKGRPSLGVSGTDIQSAYAQYYGVPQGFLVRSVVKDSGADKAGIQENDIIIGINDNSITSISQLNEIKNKYKVGDSVKITVYRNGKMIDLNVTLTESTGEAAETEDSEEENNNQNNNGNYRSRDNYDDFEDFYNNFR